MMNFSAARSERITAIISAIVAVVILAGGVTAFQSHHAAVDDVVQLESDFRFQLEVGFRHNLRERAKRLKQLSLVSKAWQESPQSDSEREKLADWLLEATIRSMPGSAEELPAIPNFGGLQPQTESIEAPSQLESMKDVRGTPDIVVEPRHEDEEFEPTAIVPTPALTLQATTPQVTKSERILQPIVSKPSVAAAPTPVAPLLASRPENVSSPAAATPVQVNLSELAARIAGFNAGLDEIESTLANLKSDDFRSLAEQIKELEQLAGDYQFLNLYYESLGASERRWLAAPRNIGATLLTLQRRIDIAQETLSSDFLGDFDASNPDRLGELRQQLAELSSHVNR